MPVPTRAARPPRQKAPQSVLAALAARLDRATGTGVADRARPVWLGLLARTIAKRTPTHSLLRLPALQQLSAVDRAGDDTLPPTLDVGEISAFYEFTLAYLDRASRKAEGQFFTPDDVARVMAAMARPGVRGVPATGSLWLDPCCGVGNLSAAVMDAQAATPADRLAFLRDRLFLNDRDTVAPELAAILLTFRADPDDTAHAGPQTVAALQQHTTHADLLGPSSGLVTAVRAAYPDRTTHPLHVIVNPPYLAGKNLAGFRTSSCGDLYAYSLDRLAEIADTMVSVTPASFLQGKSFASLRRVLLETWQHLDVWAFDNVPGNLFKGIKHGSDNSNTVNSTRAAILAAWGPRNVTQPRVTRATRFLRWKTDERDALLRLTPPLPSPKAVATVLEHELAPSPFSEEIFPKVGHDLSAFYAHAMTQWGPTPGAAPRTVGDWRTSKPTAWALTVPNSTRYFIPAIQREISRGAARVLYFPSEAIRDRAYLLINSSLTYWWWRIQDAGLSVSQSTLDSLPIPPALWADPAAPTPAPLASKLQRLVEALRQSEQANVVVKQNAGRANENIKHPAVLLARLTKAVLAGAANGLPSVKTAGVNSALAIDHVIAALAATHGNSLATSGVNLTPRGRPPVPATAPARPAPAVSPIAAPPAPVPTSRGRPRQKGRPSRTGAPPQLLLDLD